jgi:ketosteroid isomerase-like protein
LKTNGEKSQIGFSASPTLLSDGGSTPVNNPAKPVSDPQDLERALVARERAGDVDGMVALYEPHAALHYGEGNLAVGNHAIRKVFADLVATGRKFEFGKQRAAIVCGDLALTSTRLSDGTITAEVARRQSDGTWLWVIDRFSISQD